MGGFRTNFFRIDQGFIYITVQSTADIQDNKRLKYYAETIKLLAVFTYVGLLIEIRFAFVTGILLSA